MAEAYWYVAHTYSGYENKVKANLEKMIKNRDLEEQIFEVRVPVQEVVEIRKSEDEGTEKVEYTESGERKPPKKKKAPVQKVVKKKLFPGYVFVHMIMNEDNWYLVRNTRGVTGFVGSEPTRPVPLTEEEMMNLGVQAPAVQPGFEIGDSVRVINSAWVNNPVGVIREIDVSKQTVKISIPEFMNGTPVSMDFTDIAKI